VGKTDWYRLYYKTQNIVCIHYIYKRVIPNADNQGLFNPQFYWRYSDKIFAKMNITRSKATISSRDNLPLKILVLIETGKCLE